MNHLYRTLGLLLLCPILAFAQPAKQENALYRRIEQEKSAGAFPVFSPFSISSYRPEGDKEVVLKEAAFLQPNAALLRQLQERALPNLRLQVPAPNGMGMWDLDLTQVRVTSPDFVVNTSDGKKQLFTPGLFYRGILNNNPESTVSLSLFEGEVMAVLADGSGNYDLGKYGEEKSNPYVLYRSNEIADRLPFDCHTPDPQGEIKQTNGTTAECRVVRVYLECDYQLFLSKGGVAGAANYVTGLFNVVAGLYTNESIETVISEIFVWTSIDPFVANGTSSGVLSSYASTRTTYNGNLAHLLSTRSTNLGGIAYVNVLCNTYSGYAFSNIYNSYSQYPTYSWSVMVVAHEMGHNLGSQHTHWCGWPGGAIDNCRTTEGGCPPGPAPANGGTIMSYCHLVGGVGINLQNGFGPLPGDVIRTRVQNSTCTTTPLVLTLQSTPNTLVCPGQAVTLSAIGAGSYAWSPSGSLNTSTGATVVATPSITTTYTATGTQGGCTGTANITVQVQPALNFGTLASDNQTFSGTGDPNPIEFGTLPTGGFGTFTYQWYFQPGLATNPQGSSTAGWALIAGANSASYDPGIQTSSVSFAVQVDPTGGLDCSPATWASGVRQITVGPATGVNPGTLTTGNQTFCNSGGNPSAITFSQLPTGGVSYTYLWFYRDGIHYPPSGSNTSNWTPIVGGISSSYDPPALTTSRMFACRVTPTGGLGEWAAGARQITVLPPFNPGTITAADQTLCNPADPANITFSTAPSGSGSFKYQWYYQNVLTPCPTGSSATGWSAISAATASNFDPAAGGTTMSRTFALRVTPTGTPTCGTIQWANNCRKIIVPPAVNRGTLAPGNQSIAYYGMMDSITFVALPIGSGSFTYQWYMKDGLADAPTGTNTTGWTPIAEATNRTYIRLYGLATTSTFACYVTPSGNPTCGTGGWANGARQVTVAPQTSFWGTLEAGNQTFCIAATVDPAEIRFATPPTEISQPTYQWYYWDSLVANPNQLSGTLIQGATANTYDPPVGLLNNRTYSCKVGMNGSPGGTQGSWVLPTRQITVLPATEPGTIASGDESFCSTGNPSNIIMSSNPKGSGGFQWRWYYRENSAGACPTGSSIPSGWITNNTSPNITGTTFTGSGISFDPQNAGTVGKGRTFAVLITPIANGTSPACTTTQWANGCRRTAVTNCGLEPITVSANSFQIPRLDAGYPNPATEAFTISCFLPEGFGKGSVSLYDVFGKRMKFMELGLGQEQQLEINLKDLAPGTYYYCLEANGLKLAAKTMVVQK